MVTIAFSGTARAVSPLRALLGRSVNMFSLAPLTHPCLCSLLAGHFTRLLEPLFVHCFLCLIAALPRLPVRCGRGSISFFLSFFLSLSMFRILEYDLCPIAAR